MAGLYTSCTAWYRCLDRAAKYPKMGWQPCVCGRALIDERPRRTWQEIFVFFWPALSTYDLPHIMANLQTTFKAHQMLRPCSVSQPGQRVYSAMAAECLRSIFKGRWNYSSCENYLRALPNYRLEHVGHVLNFSSQFNSIFHKIIASTSVSFLAPSSSPICWHRLWWHTGKSILTLQRPSFQMIRWHY